MSFAVGFGVVIAVLLIAGQIAQRNVKRPRSSRRQAKQMAKISIPRMQDGVPDVGEAIKLANEAFAKGFDQEAIDLLTRCRNECGERELIPSVQTLSSEIIGLRHRRAADALGPRVMTALQKNLDGVIQTELYRMMPDQDQEVLRYACYRLAEAGKITREKKGRSYMLRLAEQNKLE